MLDDPGLNPEELRQALQSSWGLAALRFVFVPGHDMQAASYQVHAGETAFFLKVRFDPVLAAPLEVPRALLEAGVPNIPAPLRTRSSALSAPMGERTLMLYPFIRGRSAMAVGLTDDQWVTFGQTLRAVHDSGLESRFAQALPMERFDVPAAASVKKIREVAERQPQTSGASHRLAQVYRQQAERIDAVLARSEELGATLGERRLGRVLCHTDIHTNNILVTDAGEIHLVDWDGPMIAPRERDLWFVIGGKIARNVESHEEARFFEGYGTVSIDREAIIYYRYERFLEDLAEFGRTVFLDPLPTAAARDREVDLTESYFGPLSLLATAEQVRPVAALGDRR
jgi:spectinomycin phosphotransferase